MHSAQGYFQRFVSLGLLCCLVPNLGLALKFPDFPVHAAGGYPVNAKQGTLAIGIQVLDDPDEQKTYFHTKLSPRGFLPVFVVIENASTAQDSYIFDKTQASLFQGAEASVTNATPKASQKASLGTSLASVAVGGVAGLAVLMYSMKLQADSTEIQEEFRLKELQSTTLSPGKLAHGFLFIPIPKDGDREKIHLKIPMLKSGSDETVSLDVEF